MSDGCCRIERARNGYTVTLTDPKIAEANSKPKSNWKDPSVDYVFDNIKDVLTFLGENLDKALPLDTGDEFTKAFDKAAAKADTDA